MSSEVYLLDYGAGNVRSLVNAIEHLGYHVRIIQSAEDFARAEKLIFPGVGAFGSAVRALEERGLVEPLRAYLQSGRPFMGICIGMQVLFAESEESPGVPGLGIFPARVQRFSSKHKAVPHMGWNGAHVLSSTPTSNPDALVHGGDTSYYFVHSYAVLLDESNAMLDPKHFGFAYTATKYGDQCFVSSVRQGNIFATQFHPEKSGTAGLAVLEAFLAPSFGPSSQGTYIGLDAVQDRFTKRIIACLDVRANDDGDLVVTKGDQYDVRDRAASGSNQVRNLGKPVELARRYYLEGADEITFLNITSFRNSPLGDLPMLEVLKQTSETVFVPLTIGGGIRAFRDESSGTEYSALQVADAYFRSGADKVSIGSDAVYATEEYYARLARGEPPLTGDSAIEQIANKYGCQAVVISVDPKRVIVQDPKDTHHHVVTSSADGTATGNPVYSWYQCTVKGGREARDLDVYQLVRACEAMGAGEILLNSMDKDGTNSGYDLDLIADVKQAVRIPVIASSGAGCVEHFSQVFEKTNVESALAAGIFHRREVPIERVKEHLRERNIAVRTSGTE